MQDHSTPAAALIGCVALVLRAGFFFPYPPRNPTELTLGEPHPAWQPLRHHPTQPGRPGTPRPSPTAPRVPFGGPMVWGGPGERGLSVFFGGCGTGRGPAESRLEWE